MLSLIKELATFEKAPNEVKVTVKELERDGFGKKKVYECFVAEIVNPRKTIPIAIGMYEKYEMKKIEVKKIILHIAYCLLLLPTAAFSQDFNPPVPKPEKEKKPFWSWDKVYGGGGIGLQFGNITLVNVAPDIGYKITERYSAGIGIRYIYFADRFNNYKLNIYGGSIFNRLIVTDFLFAHAEYEILNGPWPGSQKRSNLHNVWVGGGLRQVVGNSSLNIMALWNLNDEPFNPFPNPQIRMGISIGL